MRRPCRRPDRALAVGAVAPERQGVDIAGETPDHDAVSIAIVGAKHLTLLAFLTSSCSTCLDFWDAFATGEPNVPAMPVSCS